MIHPARQGSFYLACDPPHAPPSSRSFLILSTVSRPKRGISPQVVIILCKVCMQRSGGVAKHANSKFNSIRSCPWGVMPVPHSFARPSSMRTACFVAGWTRTRGRQQKWVCAPARGRLCGIVAPDSSLIALHYIANRPDVLFNSPGRTRCRRWHRWRKDGEQE